MKRNKGHAYTAILLNFSLMSVSIAQPNYSSKDQAVINNSLAKYSKSKTLKGFIESLQGQIDESLRAFLFAKVAQDSSPHPRVVADLRGGFNVETKDGFALPFRLISLSEGIFSINNVKITYAPGTPPEVLWQKVMAAIPKQFSMSPSPPIEWFFPNAYALDPVTTGLAVLAGVAVVGLMGLSFHMYAGNEYMDIVYPCGLAFNFLQFCRHNQAELNPGTCPDTIAQLRRHLHGPIDQNAITRILNEVAVFSRSFTFRALSQYQRRDGYICNDLSRAARAAFPGFRSQYDSVEGTEVAPGNEGIGAH